MHTKTMDGLIRRDGFGRAEYKHFGFGIKVKKKEDKIMSMEVSANYKDYKNDYLERMQESKDKTKEAGKKQDAGNKSESIPIPKDEYISSEQSDRRPSGLYHMGKDENGNPKVLYDDPKKAGSTDGNGRSGVRTNSLEKDKESEQPKVKSGSREDDSEEVTGNTDAVDREIQKLKKQKQQLEQQIKAASGDEEKTKELEKKLAQVESELGQKDNDTYRRQHAVITSQIPFPSNPSFRGVRY